METYSPVPEDAEKEPREARIARLKQEGEDENEKQLHAPTSIALTVSLVALVASRSVDQVLFYRLNYAFAFYVFYLGAVILPVAFLVITVPIVWFKLAFTNDITPAMTSFPKYKFALMGLLDTLFNLLSTFPVAKLGGSLTNVLSQAVLPINMVFAYIFLRTRFGNNHYLGAFLVIYGIMIKLMPQLFGSSDSSGGSNDDGAGTVFYTFLLIFSQAFSAASNVCKSGAKRYKTLIAKATRNSRRDCSYAPIDALAPPRARKTDKETALKGANIDEWYMNVWVSVFQLGWGILCFWQVSQDNIGLFLFTFRFNFNSFHESNHSYALDDHVVITAGLSWCVYSTHARDRVMRGLLVVCNGFGRQHLLFGWRRYA